MYTKWSNPIGSCALAKNCDWFRQITPRTNLTRVSLLVEWKLTAKQELSCEIYKMLEKSSQFLSLDQPNKPKGLNVALNIAGVEKYARKTCDCGQPGGHFDSSFERSESDGGNLCSLGRWFSNQFEIVSEKAFSCDTVGRELLWPHGCTLLAAVPWNRLEHSHRKARLCVYFTWF